MSLLVVPVDASQVLPEQERKAQKIKVVVRQGDAVKSQPVSLEGGRGEVKLEVDPRHPLEVALGSASVPDAELLRFDTLTARVAPHQWGEGRTFTLPPFVVTLWWWRRWLLWCRTFVVEGRVLCPDGSPVPAAEVTAYDVDRFWWWRSVAQVGSPAITDATGHFRLEFRWCCGLRPWWWWRLRAWQLEPLLVDVIRPVLDARPGLRFREPGPEPTLDLLSLGSAALPVEGRPVDPALIPDLRERLVARLPHVPELERLRVWPWFPWTPWFDCSPDLIFRATQLCGGVEPKTIVSENVFQTRWNVPTHLDVTLVANQDACCLPDPQDDPVGDCALFTGVCGDPGIPATSIGGTSAHPAGPDGYASPGDRDRPFSEVVHLMGQFGTAAQADYYTIEYRRHVTPPAVNPHPWLPLPAAGLPGFVRGYFDATLPWPNQWHHAAFGTQPCDGGHVYESRRHYEQTHPPANWGSPLGRAWTSNANLLAPVHTSVLPDGAYEFRLKGYGALPTGAPDPASGTVLPGCGASQNNNLMVLRVDNRFVGAPTPGSVHANTTEPDCGITSVKLGTTSLAPCGSQQLAAGTPLVIEFFASDPDGHLDHYDLIVRYDLGAYKNLLSAADVGAFTLLPLGGGQAGPDYADAVAAGAVRPTWNGGPIRLTIADASRVFPYTCCYVIELRTWKRNIVNCHGPYGADDLVYSNQTHYTFTVTV